MEQALKQAGFTPMTAARKKRLILSIEGHEKTGKTHFAMTAPGPIAYFGLDIGDEGVVDKFLEEGKTILTADPQIRVPNAIQMSADGPKIDAADAWDKFKRAFVAAVDCKEVRTIIWDTATEVWELIRLARFGKLTQVMPVQYGPVNAEMRGLLRHAYECNKNFILIHKVKSVYINDKRTGDYERAGFSDIGYLVQANIQTKYDQESGQFQCKILNARQNMQCTDLVLEGAFCAFPFLAQTIFTNSDLEDWE